MTEVQKRIVRKIFPTPQIREWHMSHQIDTYNTVVCSPGHEPSTYGWNSTQSIHENSPKTFALASAIVAIPGVKKVEINAYHVWVKISYMFDFDRDKIADRVTLEVRRHVYSLRQKVKVINMYIG